MVGNRPKARHVFIIAVRVAGSLKSAGQGARRINMRGRWYGQFLPEDGTEKGENPFSREKKSVPTNRRLRSLNEKTATTNHRLTSLNEKTATTNRRLTSLNEKTATTDLRHPSTEDKTSSTDRRHPSPGSKSPSTDRRKPSSERKTPSTDRRNPPSFLAEDPKCPFLDEGMKRNLHPRGNAC